MPASYWQEKVCLVTGASAGLGLSIADALSRNGAKVILVARRRELLEAAATLIGRHAAPPTAITADVVWQEDVDRLAAEVKTRFGRLDLLCNCAGRSTRGLAIETTPEDFQQLLDVNFLAAVRATRAFAPMLIESRGHLVNIGSLASKTAPKFMGAYPASKFALAAYTQQLRLELGPQGLHVMLVCPGPIARPADSTDKPRYVGDSQHVPPEAQAPGAGARVKAVDPQELAAAILTACERRKPELVVPAKAKLLFALSQLSASWGDRILRRSTSG